MGSWPVCETDNGDAARQRECLAHLTALHPAGAVGRVTLVARLGEERRVRAGDWTATSDASRASYVSLNRHGARRRADGLVAINAGLWVDVDVDLSGEKDPLGAAAALSDKLRSRLAAARIPDPSYSLFSGRGLWFVWLLDRPLPACASDRIRRLLQYFWGPASDDAGEPRFDARTLANPRLLQNALRMHEIWRGLPLDRSVSDSQRLHRVSGSVNPKSGLRAALVWPNAWEDVRRHRFDELADAVHPYTTSEIDAYRQRKRAPPTSTGHTFLAETTVPTSAAGFKARSRARVVAEDLEQWIRFLGPDALRRRHGREVAAFLLACAYANGGEGGTAEAMATRIAPMVGLTIGELSRTLSTLGDRLRRAEAEETVRFRGREVSPVYGHRLDTMVALLGITSAEAKDAALRLLIPGRDASPLPDKERAAHHRKSRGATPREAQQAKRSRDGTGILAALAAGRSLSDVAHEMGVSASYARKARDEAAAAQLSAVPPRISSRPLLAVGPRIRKSHPAPKAEAGPREKSTGRAASADDGGHLDVRYTLLLAHHMSWRMEDWPFYRAADLLSDADASVRDNQRFERDTRSASFPWLYTGRPELLRRRVAGGVIVMVQRKGRSPERLLSLRHLVFMRNIGTGAEQWKRVVDWVDSM